MYDGTLKFDTSIDQSGFQLGLSNLGNIAKHGMAVISSVVTAAAAGISAIGTASVQTGMQFDSAMSQVGATLGYSVDQINDTASEACRNMEMLTAKAEEMGAATSFSATQAANGLNILAQSGYSAAESVQMIDSVLNMAAAGGMSLDQAASGIAGSMKGFTKEAGKFADNAEASAYYADIVAKGATLANTSVSALSEALSGASSSADAYGQSARTTEVALLRLAEQNETGSAAATALAAAMKNIYAPTDQAKKVLESILDVHPFDEVTHEARDFNTVVDELASALNQYDDQTRTELETMIFGEQGKNAFDKMVSSSAEKVQGFYDNLEYTEDGAKGSAALQAETMLDNLAGDLTILGSATEGFQIAISKNLDAPLREIVQKATEYMSDLTDVLKSRGLDGLAEALGDKIAGTLDFISGYIPGLVSTGSKLILSLLNGLVKNLPSAARTFAEAGKTLISGLIKNLPDMAVTGMTVLHTLITGMADNLPELISTGEELLNQFAESMQKKDLRFKRLGKSILKSLTNAISQNLPDLTEAVLNLIDFLVNLIPGNLAGFASAAVSILLALADGLIQSMPVLIEKAPEIISNLEQAIKDNAGLIKDSAHTILEKLGESLKNAKDTLKEKAPEIMQNVADALKNAPLAMGSVADSVITAIADALGVKDKWESFKTKVSESIGNIDFETIKLNLDIAFADIPDDVKQNFKNVSQTFSEAADRMKTSFNNLKDSCKNLKEKFQPLLDTLKEYFTSGEVGEDASDVLGTAITIVAGTIATAADSVSRLISGIMDFAAWLAESGAEADAFSAAVIGIVTTVGSFAGILKLMETVPAVIAGVQAALAGLSGSASGLWGIIAANPLAALLALLGGLIAAFVYVSQTSEEWQLGWQMMKDAWNEYIDCISEGYMVYEDTFKKIKEKIADFGDAWKTGFEEIKEKWEEFWDSWKVGEETLEQFGGNIYDFVEGAKQWGKDLIDNFIGGVKEKWNDWQGTWEGVGEVIYDLLHHTHPDKGLLKDDYTWMPDMMQSFSEGIRNNIPLVENQAEALTDTLKSALEMPSIDVPELEFSVPELPEIQLPEFSPEAWEALQFQSRITPAVSALDAGSEVINNHYSYSTVNMQNQQNYSQNQPTGDIIIPIEISGQAVQTAVISAIQIENARSGGRTV